MPATPLLGRSVVITRPGEPADGLAALLASAGAHVRSRPLVRRAPPADADALASVLEHLAEFDWIVFTSASAVHACLAAAPPGARWPRCACVGPGTAAAAREGGLEVRLVPERYTADGLVEAWPAAQLRGARVLWPRASGARLTLERELRARGAEVVACDAYATVPDPGAAVRLHDELRAAPADVLLFTSPSAVRTFAEAGVAPAGMIVGVIGTVTAAAAAAAGVAVHVIPARHTLDALVEALGDHFAASDESRGPDER